MGSMAPALKAVLDAVNKDALELGLDDSTEPLLPGLNLADNEVPKGKVAELRLELNSGGKKDKNYSAKKVALKKIVANMTMSNNDMVALFPDVVGCMQLPSLEIKKMCVRTLHVVIVGSY